MRMILLLALCSVSASNAKADVPFYPRSTTPNQSVGGLNKNFQEVSDSNINLLNTTITPTSCPAGQALTGTYQNNGTVTGGTCTAISNQSLPQTFAGPVTITSSAFSLGGSSYAGWWVPLSSGSFSSVSTVTITGLASSTTYRCDFYVGAAAGTLSQPYIVFNQSGSATFSPLLLYSTIGAINSSGGAGALVSELLQKYGSLNDGTSATGNYVAANQAVHNSVEFWTVYGTSTTVQAKASSEWFTTVTNPANSANIIGTKPLAGSGITDMEYFFAAANESGGGTLITGQYYCYKRLP